GLVMPGQIIPIAEETGSIVALGEWILFEACAQMARYAAVGSPGCRVAVNVSQVQFGRDDFVATVERALTESGLPPRLLELELTESVLMRDADVAIERVAELHAMGVSLAIDDFGTGYSSLSYLRQLPLDTLKIDRSFVHDLGCRTVTTIVEPIIAL